MSPGATFILFLKTLVEDFEAPPAIISSRQQSSRHLDDWQETYVFPSILRVDIGNNLAGKKPGCSGPRHPSRCIRRIQDGTLGTMRVTNLIEKDLVSRNRSRHQGKVIEQYGKWTRLQGIFGGRVGILVSAASQK